MAVINGTQGNDNFLGTNGHDSMSGLGGDDTLNGQNGNDTITGAIGDDSLLGGAGNDSILGGVGADIISGDAGNDTLLGNDDADQLSGGDGNDYLDAGATDLTGTNQVLTGGNGNDTYVINSLDDIINEDGSGIDTVKLSSLFAYDTFTLSGNLENLDASAAITVTNNYTGNTLNNNIIGATAQINTLEGLAGNDTLIGSTDNDSLIGGTDADRMVGGSGSDIYQVDNNRDVVVEALNAGDDTISFNSAMTSTTTAYTLANNVENLDLSNYAGYSGTQIKTVYGNILANNITASITHQTTAEVMTLRGGSGNDTITGSNYADHLYGDNDNDLISAGTGNDVAYGGNGNDTLQGGIGSDTVYGDAGNDSIEGGAEGDILYGGAGNDMIRGEAGTDYLSGDAGNDSLDGGTEGDTIYAGAGNDILQGGSEDNTLDSLYGGAGNDTFYLYSGTGNAIKDTIVDTSGINSVVLGVGYNTADADINMAEDFNNSTITNLDASLITTAVTTITGTTGANTITGSTTLVDIIHGEAGNDVLRGGTNSTTAVVDVLYGDAGNDTLYGDKDATADSLLGGAGNDAYVVNETGEAIVEELNAGTDTVILTIDANEGNYTLGDNVENLNATDYQTTNTLTLTGNELKNTITGSNASDVINGVLNDNTATGDVLKGLYGDDSYYVKNIKDSVIESVDQGYDTVYLGSATDHTFTSTSKTYTLANNVEALDMENLQLSATQITNLGAGRFSANGNTLNNVITISTTEATANKTAVNASSGDDTIYGTMYNDSILGGNGNDEIYSSSGNDTLNGGAGNDFYDLGAGTKTIIDTTGINSISLEDDYEGTNINMERGETFGSALISNLSAYIKTDDMTINGTSTANSIEGSFTNHNTIYGLKGNDTLTGGGVSDYLNGGDGNDSITGGVGEDTLLGGAGTNTLEGGADNDMYYLASNTNTIVDTAGSNAVILQTGYTNASIDLTGTTGTFGDAVIDNLNASAMTSAMTITGNAATNIILGSSTAANTIDGGDGNDTITGGDLADNLTGGTGNDSIIGGTGNDTIIGGTGNDALNAGAGTNTYQFAIGDNVDTIAQISATDTVDITDADYTDELLFYTTSDGTLHIDYNTAGNALFVNNASITDGNYNDAATIQVGDYSISVSDIIDHMGAAYTNVADPATSLTMADRATEYANLQTYWSHV